MPESLNPPLPPEDEFRTRPPAPAEGKPPARNPAANGPGDVPGESAFGTESPGKLPAESISAEYSAAGSGDYTAPVLTGPADRYRPLPPGPGLLESMFWVMGVLLLQLLAGGVTMLAVLAVHLVGTGDEFGLPMLQRLQDVKFLKDVQQGSQMALFGGSQLLFVLGMMLASRLRLGSEYRRRLALRPIPAGHVALLFTLILPLAMLSRAVYEGFNTWVWLPLVEKLEFLKSMNSYNTMELLQDMVRDTPLLALLMTVAVAPAIAEELAFRGVIGRGLLARRGLLQGMAITSLLFAAVHIYPVHVVGVIPLGLMMHFLYLTTRSFFAPVLFHFLNNSMAVFAGRMEAPIPDAGAPEAAAAVLDQADVAPAEVQLPLYLVAAALLATAGVCRLMWTTRVRWLRSDGREWSPGYPTIEAPPLSAGATARCGAVQAVPLAMALAGLAVFATAFVWWGLQQVPV